MRGHLVTVLCTLSTLAAASAFAQAPGERAVPIAADEMSIRATEFTSRPQTAPGSSRSRPRLTGWQVTVHGGMAQAPDTIVGTSALPGPGPTFVSFATLANRSSRMVDSFYFGDGAVLLNQTAAAVNPALEPALSAVRISPLDSALTAWNLSRPQTRNFGLSIGHSITQFALVEVSFEQASSRVSLTGEALATIEEARSSYSTYMPALLTRSFTSGVDVQSTAAIHDRDRVEQMLNVTASFNLGTFGGITPYFTVGGGYMRPRGDAPGFSMSGNSTVLLPPLSGQINPVPASISEEVIVRYEIEPAIVRVFGGGVRVHLNSWSGVRLDYRAYAAQEGGRLRTKVATRSEFVVDSSVPTVGFISGGNPVVQFSSNTSVLPSSLKLEPHNFTSFESIRRWSTTSFSVGYFLRF